MTIKPTEAVKRRVQGINVASYDDFGDDEEGRKMFKKRKWIKDRDVPRPSKKRAEGRLGAEDDGDEGDDEEQEEQDVRYQTPGAAAIESRTTSPLRRLTGEEGPTVQEP